MNDEWAFGLQVIQAIRRASEVSEKTPHVQWLCDMWDKELEIDRKAIEAENQVIADREMEKIRKRRRALSRAFLGLPPSALSGLPAWGLKPAPLRPRPFL